MPKRRNPSESKESLRAKRAKEAEEEEEKQILMRQQAETARRRDHRNGTVTGRCSAAAVLACSGSCVSDHAPHCLLCVKEDEENHDLLLLEQFGRDGLFDRRVVAESRLQQFFRQLLQLLGFAEPLQRPGEERTLITFEHAIQASATHATAQSLTSRASARAWTDSSPDSHSAGLTLS